MALHWRASLLISRSRCGKPVLVEPFGRLPGTPPGSPERMQEGDLEREQEEAAAAEAAAIGGRTSPAPPPFEGQPDEVQRPLEEAGQGEAEGFELAEQE